MEHASSLFDRAYGALMGIAVGDALGMPSQTLTVAQIEAQYGQITDFVAPFEDHPVSHGLSAGQVTDDTEQTLIMANRLIAGQGIIVEEDLAKDLLNWETDVKARGLRDLLGPSSKAALDELVSGASVSETGRNGTTNGAAMRIAPIGIACVVEPVSDFVDQVELACRLTHNTGEAIAAASAVAAMISCGLDGLNFETSLRTALHATEEGQRRGYVVGESSMIDRITDALTIAETCENAAAFAAKTGTSVASYQSVPAAFGLVQLAGGDPWKAALMAANIGDDTDTIGAISCAIAGACTGIGAFPTKAIATISKANRLPLKDVAHSLLSLRNSAETEHQLREACL
ncbi:MAG: ADP-ribosylglycohydrolase family protein [Pseudomonadota bacterium]